MKIIFICAIGILAISSKAQSVETPQSLRMVKGQIYNIYHSPLWHEMDATIQKVQNDLIAGQTYTVEAVQQAVVKTVPGSGFFPVAHQEVKRVDVGTKEVPGKEIIILNYPINKMPAVGQKFHFKGMQIGTTNFNGQQLELWDLGTKPTEDDLRKFHAEYSERQEADQKRIAEQHQAAKERAAVAKMSADAKALKSNQDAAAKGDSFGLMRMGERYRDGDGVEKNLVKARDYLQKAADAGSPTAKEELSKLSSQ